MQALARPLDAARTYVVPSTLRLSALVELELADRPELGSGPVAVTYRPRR